MKNKKAVLGLAALAATAVIGGTWAYWNQDVSAVNEFQTGKYDTDITEDFTPPTPGEWVPGTEWKKEVTITNTGDVKVAAIATLNQVWVRTEAATMPELDEKGNVQHNADGTVKMIPIAEGAETFDLDEAGNVQYNADGTVKMKAMTEEEIKRAQVGAYYDLTFTDKDSAEQYASIVNWGEGVVALASLESDARVMGITATVDDLTVAEAQNKWVLVSAENTNDKAGKPTNAENKGFSDVQFVYNGIIEAKGGATPTLFKSVTLNPLVETTVTKKIVTKGYDGDGNKIDTLIQATSGAYGYESAQYTMTINATTVQASASAIKDIFAAKGITEENITAFLAGKELISEELAEN